MTTAIAIAGFVISAILAGIRIREAFFLRGQIEPYIEWLGGDGEAVLRIVLLNKGSKKDIVMDLSLRESSMPVGRGWWPADLLERLPLVLPENEATAPFFIRVPEPYSASNPEPNGEFPLADALRTDRIDMLDIKTARLDWRGHPFPMTRTQAEHGWRTRQLLPRRAPLD